VLTGDHSASFATRLQASGVLEDIRGLLASVLAGTEAPRPAPAGEAPEPAPEDGAAPEDRARPPQHILALGSRLQALRGLTPDQRIARAWNLGIADREACDLLASGGRGFTAATPEPWLKPVLFVCLRGGLGAPFQTTSSGECQRRVRDHSLPGKPFLPGAVWRGLPSKAEAEAYLAGAGFAIPPSV